MTITVKGIVTRSVDYRENDKLINILSTTGEMVITPVYGARGNKQAINAATQLFIFGEFIISERNGMRSLSAYSITDAFRPISLNYNRYKAGCTMLSSANTALSLGDINNDVYVLLHSVLSYLAYSELNEIDLMIYYLLNLMAYIGFSPSITECACCGKNLRTQTTARFSPEDGGALCPDCATDSALCTATLNALELEAMRRMLLLDVDNLAKLKLPESVRANLRPVVVKYVEYQLDRTFKYQ